MNPVKDNSHAPAQHPAHILQPGPQIEQSPMPEKGKRKVKAGPMDPRKTREPVTGHPDTDLNAVLDSILLSPPPQERLLPVGTDHSSDKCQLQHGRGDLTRSPDTIVGERILLT